MNLLQYMTLVSLYFHCQLVFQVLPQYPHLQACLRRKLSALGIQLMITANRCRGTTRNCGSGTGKIITPRMKLFHY